MFPRTTFLFLSKPPPAPLQPYNKMFLTLHVSTTILQNSEINHWGRIMGQFVIVTGAQKREHWGGVELNWLIPEFQNPALEASSNPDVCEGPSYHVRTRPLRCNKDNLFFYSTSARLEPVLIFGLLQADFCGVFMFSNRLMFTNVCSFLFVLSFSQVLANTGVQCREVTFQTHRTLGVYGGAGWRLIYYRKILLHVFNVRIKRFKDTFSANVPLCLKKWIKTEQNPLLMLHHRQANRTHYSWQLFT